MFESVPSMLNSFTATLINSLERVLKVKKGHILAQHLSLVGCHHSSEPAAKLFTMTSICEGAERHVLWQPGSREKPQGTGQNLPFKGNSPGTYFFQ